MEIHHLKQFGFAFIGVSIFVLLLKLALDTLWKRTIEDRILTEGIVIEIITGRSIESNYTIYKPTIQYTVHGSRYIYQADSGSSDNSQYPLGSKQSIYYLANNPSDVVWDGGSSISKNAPQVPIFFILLSIGIVALYYAYR